MARNIRCSFFIIQTIRKDIDCITKQQEDENMRLYQSIHKMQDRLDETFLRASDTKQMGREIIKNTEDLLRGTTNKVGYNVLNCYISFLMFYAPLILI